MIILLIEPNRVRPLAGSRFAAIILPREPRLTEEHLRRLEEAGYLEVSKAFVGRKAQTTVRLTTAGRSAFADYVATLAGMLGLPLDERFVP